MVLLTERHDDQIDGVLSCYDRIVITGTLPQLCFARGMTGYLYEHGIRIFQYANFVQPFREQLRLNAQALAKANNIEIDRSRFCLSPLPPDCIGRGGCDTREILDRLTLAVAIAFKSAGSSSTCLPRDFLF